MPPQQPYKKPSILHNLRGEPDQLLIIQWAGAIFLTIAITVKSLPKDAPVAARQCEKRHRGTELHVVVEAKNLVEGLIRYTQDSFDTFI